MRFSIVLPTYNRRDTILRAVRSVQAQTFGDWELLITDDGSTDGTADVLPKDDCRIRLITQANTGVAGARNSALRARRGELVAFLDSDDEWLPHHLELADAFFRGHPDEQLLIGEFVQRWSNGIVVPHFSVELSDWFPALARRIGSTRFITPPPGGDPYLHVYAERRPLGPDERGVAERIGYRHAAHYRGSIFEAWRWGWLMLLQSTVVRSEAVEAVGLFDETYRIASDFPWMAALCRQSAVNLLTLPVVVKHEFGAEGARLAEGHLAWGTAAVGFYRDLSRGFDELFWNRLEHTAELRGIRRHWRLLLARAALGAGDRATALQALRSDGSDSGALDVALMRLFLATIPSDGAVKAMYRGWLNVSAALWRLRGALTRGRRRPR